MTDDDHADDLVGPYVMEACSPDEARWVAEHASRCAACAAEIAVLRGVAEWIGMSAARAPAPELRSRVLSAALAARPAGRSGAHPAPADLAGPNRDAPDALEARRLGELYHGQVAELDRLLSGLSQPQWLLPSGPHRSIRELVAHLYGNDERTATVAGVELLPAGGRSSATDMRRIWRRQAGAIIDVVARDGARLLDRPVRLAGRAVVRRPMREALIQRGFETWIHAEDVRSVLDLAPQPPSGPQTADIVDFALRLLPAAMEAAGRAHPSMAIRLVLTGEGGGSRLVGLSPASPAAGAVVAEVSLPAVRFCRLLAGRLTGASTNAEVDGDLVVANDFLVVAATMGCD
jgi:uncharacterized protein (TIGR03083 family)